MGEYSAGAPPGTCTACDRFDKSRHINIVASASAVAGRRRCKPCPKSPNVPPCHIRDITPWTADIARTSSSAINTRTADLQRDAHAALRNSPVPTLRSNVPNDNPGGGEGQCFHRSYCSDYILTLTSSYICMYDNQLPPWRAQWPNLPGDADAIGRRLKRALKPGAAAHPPRAPRQLGVTLTTVTRA